VEVNKKNVTVRRISEYQNGTATVCDKPLMTIPKDVLKVFLEWREGY
jgi:hypothetical protein